MMCRETQRRRPQIYWRLLRSFSRISAHRMQYSADNLPPKFRICFVYRIVWQPFFRRYMRKSTPLLQILRLALTTDPAIERPQGKYLITHDANPEPAALN